MVSLKNSILLGGIIILILFLVQTVSAGSPLGFNNEDRPQINPEETYGTTQINNTYNNNTYINVTATVNETQFTSNNPITINLTWLYNYLENLFDDVYCKLTGCTMTGDLTFDNSAIQNPNYVQFNITYADGSNEGRLQWNSEDGTLEVGMPGGNVNLQIGQENLMRVTNDESIQINNGQVVYISGGTGNNIKVKLANASSTNSQNVIGIVTENIAAGQKGYVTAFGLVRDVNTSAYVEGTLLYLSETNGEYTDTIPPAPSYTVQIGHVVRQHATEGSILVGVTIGESLSQLDDVLINSPTEGQIIMYNATSGLWYNTNISVDLSGYVPYTGATGNVELNEKNLSNVSVLDINYKASVNSVGVGYCFNGTDYIFGNYTGVAGC